MKWEYRVVQREDGSVGIQEVHYNEAGKVISWCDPDVVGYDSPGELLTEIVHMAKACALPVIGLNEEQNRKGRRDAE